MTLDFARGQCWTDTELYLVASMLASKAKGWPANPELVYGTSSPILFGRVYMWMRPSWDSQYTRTETERATTPYYYTPHNLTPRRGLVEPRR